MKNKTDITMILDRSGSMATTAEAAVNGFNSFLKDQMEAPGEASITLVMFNERIETVYSDKNIKHAENLTRFAPEGSTSLLDAMGSTIDAIGHRLSMLPESDRPEKVVVVVITDGEENTSKKYSWRKVSAMVKHQTEVYGWTFAFIGASIDAIATAGKLNVASAASYNATKSGTGSLYSGVSNAIRSLRSASGENLAKARVNLFSGKKSL